MPLVARTFYFRQVLDMVFVSLEFVSVEDLLKQPGIFDEIVLYFRSILEDLPDKRRGKNKPYQMSDAAILCIFGLFYSKPLISGASKVNGTEKRV